MPEIQKTYWCIASSAESVSYGMDKPQKPHEVVLDETYKRRNSDIVKAHSFYSDKDVIKIDDDYNSTYFVKRSELYETKEAALIAYKEEIQNFIDELESDIAGWREHLKTLD